VAGLGIGISPIHQTVPPALVAACAELALPLLEVPPSIPFIAISEAVVSELEARRHADLRRLNQAQRSLIRAVTLPSAIPAIVRQLAEHLQAGVILAEPGRPAHLTAGSPLPSDEAIAAIVSQVAEKATGTSSVMHDGSTYLLVQPVLGERHRAALVITRPTPLSAPERGIVSAAISVLALVRHGATSGPGLLLASALARRRRGPRHRVGADGCSSLRGTAWFPLAGRGLRSTGQRPVKGILRRWHAELRATLASPLVADASPASPASRPPRCRRCCDRRPRR
jgi:hypothetical protein